MKPDVTRNPRIPADERLVELALEGIPAWFRLHVSQGLPCSCGLMGPGADCDVGTALYRLSASARRGGLDWHKRAA